MIGLGPKGVLVALSKGEQLVFGSNDDMTRPGAGWVYVNKPGVAKQGWEQGATGEGAHWASKLAA